MLANCDIQKMNNIMLFGNWRGRPSLGGRTIPHYYYYDYYYDDDDLKKGSPTIKSHNVLFP